MQGEWVEVFFKDSSDYLMVKCISLARSTTPYLKTVYSPEYTEAAIRLKGIIHMLLRVATGRRSTKQTNTKIRRDGSSGSVTAAKNHHRHQDPSGSYRNHVPHHPQRADLMDLGLSFQFGEAACNGGSGSSFIAAG
ncbi:hypothetical protein CTI12_AA017040 [Artemisia annua]|uniref:Uncharacterized protein n=1 Tax=Artemisia annua TaxID=35608 RepID=A0A2U1QKN5_ARTAN|nr:hypothetical protein CTI12_AA017040 [Artemisia annua]